jgi:CHAT domain-containing protein
MDPEPSIADIDCNLSSLQNSLLLYPRFHLEHISCVISLAKARWDRYQLLDEKEDLDKAIIHYTEAILLSPVSRDDPHFENVIQPFFHLACALVEHFEFEESEDVKYPIAYLRFLRGLRLDSFDLPRDVITTALIRALSIQAELDGGDATRNTKEMAALWGELLTSESNVSTDLSAEILLFKLLHQAIESTSYRGHVESLDTVIEFMRDEVKKRPPDSNPELFALAIALRVRFNESHSKDDYEEAMALLEKILDHSQPGECPDSIRGVASFLATELADDRSTIFGNPEYSEVTIARLRALFGSSSQFKRSQPELAEDLALAASKRFEQYNLPESLEEAKFYTSQVAELSSSESLEESVFSPVLETLPITKMTEKIQRLEELLSITPPGTDCYSMCTTHLADWYRIRSYRTNDMSDLEESIKYSRLELKAAYPGNRRGASLISLQDDLFNAFEKTNKINYLDDSIEAGYDILKLESARDIHFHIVRKLVTSLLTREELLASGQREDRHEAIRLISTVIEDQYAREPDRFRLSCRWAVLARSIGHRTTLTAYKTAMSLMQKSLSFAPTVSVQHTQLVASKCQTMPLDYASFHLDFVRLEDAVETLEQGRVLLWSEMRGLRTSAAQLVEKASPFAKRFGEINRELEALTIDITPSGKPKIEDGSAQGGDWSDPFGRLVIQQRKLVEERDTLVSKIQGQPGFEGFLKMPPFGTLRSAASRGPVILINHCQWRSDILIIFPNILPCSIPTAGDFYDRANKLRDELVEARKRGLGSDKYQDALCSVLKGLYELVGEPVIERLRMLGVPEQSRIWWCPTSVFCSLPLHAMGPIPSSDAGRPRYFSDLYIPSYTPSLSALIESRRESPQKLEKPSLLLVAQPEDLPAAEGEIKVIQQVLKGRVTVTSLVSSEATPTSVIEGLRGNQFAHFACHGVLETGKPFDARFKLHGGSRLTLLDIAQSRLPDAEFAFLSCCHAAEITEDSIADEALHLTAAMQYRGFRSVVGTMWEMADVDGRDLAKTFYKSVFSSQEIGVPYYERTAHALRDATQKLRRKKGIKLERWVNFVHYGA